MSGILVVALLALIITVTGIFVFLGVFFFYPLNSK